MQITLNGASRDVPDRLTAGQLIGVLGLAGKRLAIEVNAEIVPCSTLEEHILNPGDTVEIVQAIGGG